MIEQIKHIEDLTVIHWFLAYAGLVVHVFSKIAETQGSIFRIFNRKEIFTVLSSIVLIPIILIICTDTGIKEQIPITYATSFLTGYSTESIVRTITKIGRNKINHENNQ